MQPTLLYGSLLVTLVLGACAPLPVATTYRISTQPRMQSAAHWWVLADDSGKAFAQASQCSTNKTLYVNVTSTPVRSDFGEAFATDLAHSLMHFGCRVTQGHQVIAAENDSTDQQRWRAAEASALTLQFGVERIDHSTIGTARPFPGLFTLLGAGIWLGHQAQAHWSEGSSFIAAVPAGAAVDLLSGVVTTPTHTEIIVTLLATSANGQVIFHEDRSYYVNDADADEYPNSPTFVASGQSQKIASFPFGIK